MSKEEKNIFGQSPAEALAISLVIIAALIFMDFTDDGAVNGSDIRRNGWNARAM